VVVTQGELTTVQELRDDIAHNTERLRVFLIEKFELSVVLWADLFRLDNYRCYQEFGGPITRVLYIRLRHASLWYYALVGRWDQISSLEVR
jgi:hypothetical protein